MTKLQIAGKEVKVSNLDKVWWPDLNLTKGDVINYYIAVAPWLLPHLQDRPLVLTRYPDGWQGKSFYQKNVPSHAPEWLTTWPLTADKGRTINYCLVDDVAALTWVVNSGAFEIHPFLSRTNNLECPTYMVFDLDPMENTTWSDVCQIAMVVANGLDSWGLQGFPKTSGATGMQIFVPVRPVYAYGQIREVAQMLCQAVNATLPQLTTLERSIAKREGKLYLDYLQNSLGKTLATVYGLRPQTGAPVSAPLTWEEVAAGKAQPHHFHIHTILDRIKTRGDLFLPLLQLQQSLDHLLEVEQ